MVEVIREDLSLVNQLERLLAWIKSGEIIATDAETSMLQGVVWQMLARHKPSEQSTPDLGVKAWRVASTSASELAAAMRADASVTEEPSDPLEKETWEINDIMEAIKVGHIRVSAEMQSVRLSPSPRNQNPTVNVYRPFDPTIAIPAKVAYSTAFFEWSASAWTTSIPYAKQEIDVSWNKITIFQFIVETAPVSEKGLIMSNLASHAWILPLNIGVPEVMADRFELAISQKWKFNILLDQMRQQFPSTELQGQSLLRPNKWDRVLKRFE